MLAAFCLLASMNLLFSTTHARQVVGYSREQRENLGVSDLHPHVDKQFGKQVTKAPADATQVDSRSLRLRDLKKRHNTGTSGHWFDTWRDQLATLIS